MGDRKEDGLPVEMIEFDSRNKASKGFLGRKIQYSGKSAVESHPKVV